MLVVERGWKLWNRISFECLEKKIFESIEATKKEKKTCFSWSIHFHPQVLPRYIKVKVEHYLLFMFSPPKISWVVSGIKYICLHLLPVFYPIQPSSKQIICFDFQKQNSVLPTLVFYVPWVLRWAHGSDDDE
jgi:hypothetical protein